MDDLVENGSQREDVNLKSVALSVYDFWGHRSQRAQGKVNRPLCIFHDRAKAQVGNLKNLVLVH